MTKPIENYDIPGRSFKDDLSFGKIGETLVSGFLDAISGGSFEVKTDRYRNGRMVVETDQNPRGAVDADGNQIWVKSGINITEAKWWVYVFSEYGAFVCVDTARLKRFLRHNKKYFNENTKIDLGRPDNPARGFLLKQNHVMDLLTNRDYD